MQARFSKPSPALVVAIVALFVALGGTAGAVVTAAVPLAKRALVADNAKKVGGMTAAQVAKAGATAGATAAVAAVAQALPTAATSLISTQTASFSLSPNAEQAVTAQCASGSKALSGGFINPTTALVISAGSTPTSDGSGWAQDLINLDDSTAASGTVIAVCLK